MIRNLVNFILFQATWFACILGAARGYPWFGVVFAGVAIAVHFAGISRHRRADLLLFTGSAVVGYVADSIMVLSGVLWFPEQAVLGMPSTFWMIAMWVNLATTLDASLRWMRGRYRVAAVIGFIAGPLSYWAGARLGAVVLNDPLAVPLVSIGIEWLLAMPLLALLADRLLASNGPVPTHADSPVSNAEITSAGADSC